MKNVAALSVERQEKILEYLNRDNTVKVSDLSCEFEVTEKTIRQDLIYLEQKGLLRRIHGGAVLPDIEKIFPIAERQSKHISEKQMIAKKALTFISEEDTIFLDGGSTLLELAKLLGDFPVSVVTNDIKIAHVLADQRNIQLVVPGGVAESASLFGPLASDALSNIRVNRLFLGTTGVDPDYGLSVLSRMQADFKRSILGISKQITLLVDHTKFGQSGLIRFADLSIVDDIIVNKELNDLFKKKIKQQNINLILA